MRILLVLSVAFASLALGGYAKAQGRDGSFFLRACEAAEKQSDGAKLSQEESLLALYCASYVSGFLDAMSLTVTTTKGTKIVCTPERGITLDQAARILVKYLRENPETLHQSGRTSLYVALAKAFPCKQ